MLYRIALYWTVVISLLNISCSLMPMDRFSAENQAQEQAGVAQSQKCSICFDDKESHNLYQFACGHTDCCIDCLKGMLDVARKSKSTQDLKCTSRNPTVCGSKFTIDDIRNISDDEGVVRSFEYILFKEYIEQLAPAEKAKYKYCRTPDCPAIFKNETHGRYSITCEDCQKTYCANCCVAHGPRVSCKDAKLSVDNDKSSQETQKWIKEHTQPCPKCKTSIQRTGGCKHMKCEKCRHEFCWVCKNPFFAANFDDHKNCKFPTYTRERAHELARGGQRQRVARQPQQRMTATEIRRQATLARAHGGAQLNDNQRAILGIRAQDPIAIRQQPRVQQERLQIQVPQAPVERADDVQRQQQIARQEQADQENIRQQQARQLELFMEQKRAKEAAQERQRAHQQHEQEFEQQGQLDEEDDVQQHPQELENQIEVAEAEQSAIEADIAAEDQLQKELAQQKRIRNEQQNLRAKSQLVSEKINDRQSQKHMVTAEKSSALFNMGLLGGILFLAYYYFGSSK